VRTKPFLEETCIEERGLFLLQLKRKISKRKSFVLKKYGGGVSLDWKKP
jgi:hypothetical protein